MKRKKIYRYPIIACFLFSLTAHSGANAASPEAIKSVESDLVKQICADGGKWLTCYGKDPGKCESYAKAMVGPCVENQLKYVEGKVSIEQALQYAVESKGCINKMVPSVLGDAQKTKECQDQHPKHLR
jgi:hypothetical protein